MTLDEYNIGIETIIQTIINDPTKARAEYGSPRLLAEHVFSTHVDQSIIDDGVVRICEALKGNKALFGYGVLDFKSSIKTLIRQNKRSISFTKEEKIIAELGEIPSDSADFVEMYMEKKAIHMRYNNTFEHNGKTTKSTYILTEMLTCVERLGLKYNRDLVERNFDKWKNEERHNRLPYFRNMLSSPKQETTVRAKFSEACKGYFVKPDFAEAAILNFMWLVKRELFGLRIKLHHFLSFYSDQGTGKTTFVDLLKTPILELSKTCSINQLLDEKNIAYPEYFILDFDDLSYVHKNSVGDLKNIITAPTVSRRLYFSQEVVEIDRKFHGVATSNKRINEVVKDGEMRRFVEVEIKPLSELSQKDWDAIAGIDYLSLWQSVDHNGPDPLSDKDRHGRPYYDTLNALQKKMVVENLAKAEDMTALFYRWKNEVSNAR
jgi:hypothetical protein